jgi:hypothetical protein
MEKMFQIETYDNIIPEKLRQQVWDYIQNSEWHVYWKETRPYPGTYYDYTPAKEGTAWRKWDPMFTSPSLTMPRACFASDDASLKKDHPVLWKLWKAINSHLGNKYIIEGEPEGMVTDRFNDPKWTAQPTKNPNIEQGWRVYANSQPQETIKRSHGVHRDTHDVNDENTCTILYFANLEWYPTWFAECMYYPNDVDETTGDHQQFQAAAPHAQKRNFAVGWGDEGKLVSPVPGRIIVYDGRTLHTTRPAAVWAREARKAIAFRVRLKKV